MAIDERELDKAYDDPRMNHTNWYKQKPYGFVFTARDGEKSTFYLPIAPSNINITTHWATNVISTMYGTVEEHSEQRYYDIQISGSTGMAPRYYDRIERQKEELDIRTEEGDEAKPTAPSGRSGYAVKGLINTGGFAQRTKDLVDSVLNNAADLFGEEKNTAGLSNYRTGYVAFHMFYRWLLAYKRDVSGESSQKDRGRHPLKFVNYKDNNEYDVAINGFQLTRDASNPMLYNYNITMRAYNLRNVDSSGPDLDVAERKADLGLDGIETSLFAKMANKARQAKNAAYAAIAAAKGFGG